MLDSTQLSSILSDVANSHTRKLTALAYLDRADPHITDEEARHATLVMASAYSLAARKGVSATVTETDRHNLVEAGLSESQIQEVDAMLTELRRQRMLPVPSGKLQDLLARHDLDATDPVHVAQSQMAYLAGMAQALLNFDHFLQATPPPAAIAAATPFPRPSEPPRHSPHADSSTAEQAANADEALAPAHSADPVAAPSKQHTVRQLLGQTSPEGGSSSIPDLLERLIEGKTRNNSWKAKSSKQCRQTINFFMRATGIDDINTITQFDLALFKDCMLSIPTSYDKSSANRGISIESLIEEGRQMDPTLVGLEPKTINRHFSMMNQLLREAKSRGFARENVIDIGLLRIPVRDREQDERIHWSSNDLQTLFSHPTWSGHRIDDRHTPGDHLTQDALYWVPILGYYTGARREEICGLLIDDISCGAAIPHILIRPNALRGLKTPQSKRAIPLHEEVLRLGFDEYVAQLKAINRQELFPDLAPAKAESPRGEQFYNDFKPILNKILPNHQDECKSFHSFRHGLNIQLRNNRVGLELREELMGHRIGSESADRYVEPLPLEQKCDAISLLSPITSILSRRIPSLRVGREGSIRTPKRRKSDNREVSE